jgi:glucosamine--fructose-6-phosphate aminotransferase (isomerizing)
MKSLGNFPDPFIAEIAGQPAAVRRAAAAATQHADLLSAAASARLGRIVLSGMGSSYDACYPASTELAAAGIAAPMHDAAELLHFRLAALGGSDLLVLVSQSGESAETVGVARALRSRTAGAPTIVSVTNGIGNTLSGLADVALDTNAGDETGPSTMTFASALTMMGALARTIAGRDPTDAAETNAREADRAADAIERLTTDSALPEQLASWHAARATTVILGRGAARAAAEMGALTVKEAVGMPIEALQTAQFRHGPLELAGPGLAAIVIATEPETAELDGTLAQELVRLGSAVLLITAGGPAPEEITSVDVGELDRLVCPAAAVVPVQLLAWRLSVERGRAPGSYLHATKVTTRE